MNKTARTIFCLLLMLALMSPTAISVEAYTSTFVQDTQPCTDDDVECLAWTYSVALSETKVNINNMTAVSERFRSHLSTRLGVDLKLDQNFQMTFRKLFPNMAREIEKDVLTKYGFKLPYIEPKAALETIGLIVGVVAGVVYLAEVYDNRVNDALIAWMVRDLQSRGWSQQEAEKEANFTFATIVQPVTNGLGGPIVVLANLFRDFGILKSGKYYSAYEQLHRQPFAYFRSRRPEGERKPPSQDNGRSYIEWAARREGSLGHLGGIQAGCSIAVWVEGHHEHVVAADGITLTVIWVEGHYECLVR